jgi:hypothetical protein
MSGPEDTVFTRNGVRNSMVSIRGLSYQEIVSRIQVSEVLLILMNLNIIAAPNKILIHGMRIAEASYLFKFTIIR